MRIAATAPLVKTRIEFAPTNIQECSDGGVMVRTRDKIVADDFAVVQAERRRVARELHDSTSQLLVVLQLHLGELRRSRTANQEPVLDEMAQTIRDIQSSIIEIGRGRSGRVDDVAPLVIARQFHSFGRKSCGPIAAGR